MMHQIITSWTDNDAYNLHQASFMCRRHRRAWGVYAYKCRSAGVNLIPLLKKIKEQIRALCNLRITPEEAGLLAEHTRCHPKFIKAITGVRILEMKHIKVEARGGVLSIRYEGPIWKRILVETPLLALISELYFAEKMGPEEYALAHIKGAQWIEETAKELAGAPEGFALTEGGTRRRFSKRHYETVLQTLKQYAPKQLAGTSNVYYGIAYGIPIVGTMAHQLQMYYQATTPLQDSITKCLLDWDKEFGGTLGTALSDTLGDRKWNQVFTKELMAKYHTERHDSGCPFAWGERRLAAIAREGLSTQGRSLLFSDSLDIGKAISLYQTFSGRIGVKIMIGTYLTNTIPIEGHKALSQVIKLMWAAPDRRTQLRPLAKLSADMEKSQCECSEFEAYAIWEASNCYDPGYAEAA